MVCETAGASASHRRAIDGYRSVPTRAATAAEGSHKAQTTQHGATGGSLREILRLRSG